jgi:acetyltransferase
MLQSLFSPESVAVIGASRTPGKVGHELLRNLREGGYQGRIVPVNPHAQEILGLPCLPSLRDFSGKIEQIVIAVPAADALAALEQAGWVQARTAVVLSSGFKEASAAGAELERRMAAFCKERGIRLLGPNSVGLINTGARLNATFAREAPVPGNVSVLSQSGALCAAILGAARDLGIGIAKLASLGNKADLSEIDLLEALAEDEQTQVVACYLESVESGPRFLRAADAVASRKPLIILKAGSTAAGARAVSSHTGAMAGGDSAYGAAFKRSGVVRADSFDSLVDYTRALAMQPLPPGRRVAVVSNAGGPAILAADSLERCGIELAPFAPATAGRLAGLLPAGTRPGNPVDLRSDAPPERFAEACRIVRDDPEVAAVLVLLAPLAMTGPVRTAELLGGLPRGHKPLIAAFMGGGEEISRARRALTESGIPNFASPGRAVGALQAMIDFASWRIRPPRVVARLPVNRRRVERILARCQRSGRDRLPEIDAKEVLRSYDFHVPDGELVTGAEEAVAAAERLGFPVAIKVVSPDVPHKAAVGGVRLGVSTAESVRDAFDLMMLRIPRQLPGARIDGLYVERMAPKGREVILGMTRDPKFGPMLMFGLGGIFVEVMQDVAFHLAPITHDEAMQMLSSTRSFKLLEGNGTGGGAVDLEAIATALQRVSQLATDFPQIRELDINPFIVGPAGTTPVVADARMILARKDQER